jgi:PAN domain
MQRDVLPEHAMSVRQPVQVLRLIAAHCLGAALLIALVAAPAHAEIITEAELVNGRTMTQPQCAALQQAVWISAEGRTFCIRYFLSTAGGEGARPVVFLNGDAGKIMGDFNTDVRARYADRMSKEFKTTMIYLARMGLDGSSGWHRHRHTLLELQATNAALDAIKQRYGFAGFDLYGHSGGAMLVAGLLGLRTDITCAAPADGILDGSAKVNNVTDPALRIYYASEFIPAIARNSSARTMVLADPQDHIAPIATQLPFVEKLRKAGGKVELYFVDSGGDGQAEHHFTTGHAELIMRDCMRGASYTEIAADLADLVAKALARQVAADKAKAETSARVKTQDAMAPSHGRLLDGINLSGADYFNFWIESADSRPCQNACRSDAKCAAWTYVQPGVQGDRARCWLKNRVQFQSTCCISGVERAEDSAAKRD